MDENKATSQLEMESLINRYLADIDVIKGKIKEQNDMLNDSFNNDKEYAEQQLKVKEETRKKNAIKQRIMKEPAVSLIAEKIKGMRTEMKDAQDALSDYVREYQRNSNLSQIVLPNGDVMQIVHVTRLRKVTKE